MHKNVTLLILASCVFASGCADRSNVRDSYNFVVIADKEFVKKRSDYDWIPGRGDKLFGGFGNADGNLSFNENVKPEDLVAAIAVIVAVIIVTETAEITYHNIKGMNVSINVEGDVVSEKFPLDWGVNRFCVSELALSELEAGRARVFICSNGTRKLKLQVPCDGLKIRRDVHVIEFSDSGNVIVDGNRINLSTKIKNPPNK